MPSFLRRIEIVVHRDNTATLVKSALEDDYHHFRVALNLQQNQIHQVLSTGLRTPYTLCARAGEELQTMRGLSVAQVMDTLPQHVDARLQCTHQLDMAVLAIAAVARDEQKCSFRVEVPRHIDNCTSATLWRNGEELLHWQVDNSVITAPDPFSGVSLLKGMASWARQTLDSQTAEAALVLRRAAMISRGRLRNLDVETHAKPLGNCFVQQPERASSAQRNVGSTMDFSERPEVLCATDMAWLNSAQFDI